MATDDSLFSTSSSVPLPRTMPSESSNLHHPTNTPKKGGHGGGTTHKYSDSTSAGSSTIMTLVPSSSGGGSGQITTTAIVGPTAAATGGAAPGTANKRGRKPGPLSKSAREAQRRLNHSIIEKARRTKINDALATLKQLVPVDYLQTREIKKAATAVDGNDNDDMIEEEGEDEDLDDLDEGGDEDDSEYRDHSSSNGRTSASTTSIINLRQNSSSNSKTNPASKGGKKQEKEKEFKLEILVRTVVFLQDLLERVDHLESAVGTSKSISHSATVPQHCATCGNTMTRSPSSSSTTTTMTTANNKKRKREYSYSSPTIEKDLNDAPHERGQSRSRMKIARTGVDDHPTPHFPPQQQRHTSAQSPRNTASSSPSLTSSSAESKRLPSISSWLNNDDHGPILPSPLSFGTFVGTVAGREGGRNKIIYSPRDNTSSTSNAASTSPSYLPSPPPSTHCFDPIRTYNSTQVPPILNLGPGATSASSSSSSRSLTTSKSFGKSPASVSGSLSSRPPSSNPPTPLVLSPEDESAASMLLQIASSSSPQFQPINPPAFSTSASSASSAFSKTRSTTTSPSFPGYLNTKNPLPEPTHFSLHPSHQNPHPRSQRHVRPNNQHPQTQTQRDDHSRQVETPSSMLGIRKY